MNPVATRTIDQIASTRVLRIEADLPIARAIDSFIDCQLSCLVVVEGDRPLGVVTESDLVRLSCSGYDETKPVRDIMSTPLLGVPHDLDFTEAQAMLNRCGGAHLVLLDPSGKLYGVVTETDLRRHLEQDLYGAVEYLDNLMDAPGPLTDPATPLALALETMASQHLDYLVIGHDGCAEGILTEHDLLPLLAAHFRTTEIPVARVMATGLQTIPVDTPLTLATERLIQTGRRHLVVVDAQGRYVGTLSQHRLLERLSSRLPEARRRHPGERIRTSEGMFRAFVENLPFPLCLVNKDEELIYANRRFVELFGYTLEDLPTVGAWWSRAYPDDDYRHRMKATWYAAVAEAQQRGTPICSAECRVTSKDGVLHYVDISAVLLGSNLLVTFIDETDRHAERARADEFLERLQKIAAKVPGVVYQYQQWPDGHTAIPYASPGIRDVYGVTPEQVTEDATPVFKALHPDDLERVAASIQDSMEHLTAWHDVHRAILPDGHTLWLEGEAEPEAMPDGSVLWHGYIRDITRARETEQRLRAQLEELRRWQSVMLDREERILAIKAEVNALLTQLGKSPRYPTALDRENRL